MPPDNSIHICRQTLVNNLTTLLSHPLGFLAMREIVREAGVEPQVNFERLVGGFGEFEEFVGVTGADWGGDVDGDWASNSFYKVMRVLKREKRKVDYGMCK